MSSLLFKNDINNILPTTTTENNVKPLNNIKINDMNGSYVNSVTSSAFMGNVNLNTATSSANASQMVGGGYEYSATSDLNSDINNLVNMLTSESNIHSNKSNSQPSLENKLRKMLNQDGGNFSDELSTDELESRIYNIVKNNNQKGGVNLSDVIKVGLAGTGAYLAYNALSTTESEVNVNKLLGNNTQPISNTQVVSNTQAVVRPTLSNVMSATSSEMPLQVASVLSDTSVGNSENVFLSRQRTTQPVMDTTTDAPFSPTSSYVPVDKRLQQLNQTGQPMLGGNDDMLGGNNPALVAFRTIVKNTVQKLDIKYNKALKVAAKIQADVKAKDPKISHEKLADAAEKQLKENMEEYKKFAKTL